METYCTMLSSCDILETELSGGLLMTFFVTVLSCRLMLVVTDPGLCECDRILP